MRRKQLGSPCACPMLHLISTRKVRAWLERVITPPSAGDDGVGRITKNQIEARRRRLSVLLCVRRLAFGELAAVRVCACPPAATRGGFPAPRGRLRASGVARCQAKCRPRGAGTPLTPVQLERVQKGIICERSRQLRRGIRVRVSSMPQNMNICARRFSLTIFLSRERKLRFDRI
jgi:hypothetical protein